MKQLDVFKKIGGILKELNDQYNYLEAESSELNELELELFVANAHFLKDHAEILRRLHERANPVLPVPVAEKPEPVIEISKPIPLPLPPPAPIEKKPEPVTEPRYFEPVVQQKPVAETKLELSQDIPAIPVQPPYNPVQNEPEPAPVQEEQQSAPTIDLKVESTGDTYSFERHEQEPVKEELELEQAAEWEDEEDHFEQEELTEQLPLVEADTQPVAEQELTVTDAEQTPDHANKGKAVTDDKVLTINQKISALKAEKDKVAATTSPAAVLPITDLKSAINLNDKLLYIKDLFNGYSLAYSEAIEIANRFNSFDEAERFLKTNYVVKNNWESKPATAEKFYALLKRRYPTG
ncbi:hypothetical protein [Mucilaginibacter sp. SG564]|uniref:hypothetical protein n=1 Tax=Mucilaginibacter sp. SG564 TaxID=2587022 RepID=UPI001555EE39|nr:hypothetical protein [Mucilaginibacter sp. SG564]NOW97603.1 hypothetical protein [Mucilaginibacter sp. SG564]